LRYKAATPIGYVLRTVFARPDENFYNHVLLVDENGGFVCSSNFAAFDHFGSLIANEWWAKQQGDAPCSLFKESSQLPQFSLV
jgi:hypothetical protein